MPKLTSNKRNLFLKPFPSVSAAVIAAYSFNPLADELFTVDDGVSSYEFDTMKTAMRRAINVAEAIFDEPHASITLVRGATPMSRSELRAASGQIEPLPVVISGVRLGAYGVMGSLAAFCFIAAAVIS